MHLDSRCPEVLGGDTAAGTRRDPGQRQACSGDSEIRCPPLGSFTSGRGALEAALTGRQHLFLSKLLPGRSHRSRTSAMMGAFTPEMLANATNHVVSPLGCQL